VKCPRCSAENSAGMRFCGQCGASLGAVCPSCGFGNPTEHRFCGQCGAALERAAPYDIAAPEPDIRNSAVTAATGTERALPGEMKQVTVMFCDIVGSTPLTERLGPEAMRDLVSSFLAASLAEVRRFGGTAPQFTGDGFMALFGAPFTHEDHVQRALLAALAIQRALGGTQDKDAANRLDLPVRIGVHTGPVVFGPVGDSLPMDYTVIGDTANVAARLQQAAEPGTILLSEATYLSAEGYARVDPVGPLTLKGKADPVSGYRLLGVSHSRAALRASTSGRATIFVDRQSERAILNNFLQQVENGRGQAVGLVGEPGIGKSRLLVEFRHQLAEERVTWIEGRCPSYGTKIPYLLALDLLRSNCGIVETDTPDAITAKVRSGLQEVGMDPDEDGPVLLHLFDIRFDIRLAGSLAMLPPEAVKARAFEIFRELSIKTSRRRPLVLVLEDLHWVDKISEELLGYLAESIRDARILLLAAYRPGYRPPWMDKSYAGQAPLQPLSRNDSIHMVRSVLRPERLLDLVTEEIITKGDGNPLFLEQLALHAGEARDLRSDLMVPDTIHDVVMARIDRLPGESKKFLQIAAVIGREFSPRLLGAVWTGSGSLETHLRELSRLEFVYERVETDGITYVFWHALTQEAVYGSLLERHRRMYHSAVGHALEELYSGRTDEVAEILALHFGRSDEAHKAIDYAILAAEKAQRRWANSEALTYFGDALQRLAMMPDTPSNRLRRIDAVLKQAEVKFALGRPSDHAQALAEIRDIVELTGDPRRRATWHYWTGFLQGLTGGRPDVAIDHCREAAAIASASGMDEIEAFATSCLAQLYVFVGRPADAIEAGERAVSSFEAHGNLWWAGRTLQHLSSAANALGEWNVSLRYSRRLVEHGHVLKDLRIRAIGSWRMGWAHIEQGDVEQGLQFADEVLAQAPIPYDSAMARAIRGYGEIKAGRVDAGIKELGDAVDWFRSSHLQYAYLRFALWLAEGHLRRSDRDSARPLLEEILQASRATGYRLLEALACSLRGDSLAAEAPQTAEDHLETAMRIFEGAGARNDLAKAMVTRAALRQSAGDLATARQLLEQAQVIFETLGTRNESARVNEAIGALDRSNPIRLLGGIAMGATHPGPLS
jgi:class 3 adenylate cyclase/tetratricopeptide (TPR) repeat protein